MKQGAVMDNYIRLSDLKQIIKQIAKANDKKDTRQFNIAFHNLIDFYKLYEDDVEREAEAEGLSATDILELKQVADEYAIKL